jgi:hypothetical protein
MGTDPQLLSEQFLGFIVTVLKNQRPQFWYITTVFKKAGKKNWP